MNKSLLTNAKECLSDIIVSVSWMDFSNRYFHRSSSWFYHKMNGIDGNGKIGGFNDEERIMLKNALIDLSERIRKAAEKI